MIKRIKRFLNLKINSEKMPEIDLSKKEYQRITDRRRQAKIREQKEKEKNQLIRIDLSEEEYKDVTKTRERMQNLRQKRYATNTDLSHCSQSKLVEMVRALNLNSSEVYTIEPNAVPYTTCHQCSRPLYSGGPPDHAIRNHPENFDKEELMNYLKNRGVKEPLQLTNSTQNRNVEMVYAIKRDLSIIETSKETAMSLCKKGEALMWSDGLNIGHLKENTISFLRDEKYRSSSWIGKLAINLSEFTEGLAEEMRKSSEYRGLSDYEIHGSYTGPCKYSYNPATGNVEETLASRNARLDRRQRDYP
jgi:hypothetical protein